MAADVLPSIVRSHRTARELDDEHSGQRRLDELQIRPHAAPEFIDQESDRDPDQGECAHGEFPGDLMPLDEHVEPVATSHFASLPIRTVDDQPDAPYGSGNVAQGDEVKIGRLATLLAVVALTIGACEGAGPTANPNQAPRFVAQPTPTSLATEPPSADSAGPVATPKGTAKPKATPKPTAKPRSTSFYKPPGWDGHSDVNCSDFDTHAHAQSFFIGTGGSKTYDPYGLDGNHDGVACQSLP